MLVHWYEYHSISSKLYYLLKLPPKLPPQIPPQLLFQIHPQYTTCQYLLSSTSFKSLFFYIPPLNPSSIVIHSGSVQHISQSRSGRRPVNISKKIAVEHGNYLLKYLLKLPPLRYKHWLSGIASAYNVQLSTGLTRLIASSKYLLLF